MFFFRNLSDFKEKKELFIQESLFLIFSNLQVKAPLNK